MARDKLPPPPSSITGDLGNWLHELWSVVNYMPQFSTFSGTTPNSNLTGLAGDFALNYGSASTDTRLWIKGGSLTSLNKSGWVTVRTGPI